MYVIAMMTKRTRKHPEVKVYYGGHQPPKSRARIFVTPSTVWSSSVADAVLFPTLAAAEAHSKAVAGGVAERLPEAKDGAP